MSDLSGGSEEVMGKRRARFEQSEPYFDKASEKKYHNVEPLYPRHSPWSPLGDPTFERRDQHYVRKVKPQNANQEALQAAMAENSLVVAVGPAGTGKTYLAISAAVEALDEGRVDRIVLSRARLSNPANPWVTCRAICRRKCRRICARSMTH